MEDPMRKIGIVSEYFYPHVGGITEHVYFSAKELASRGYQVVIFTGYRGETAGIELPKGVRVRNLARSMPVYANGSIGKISYGWNVGKAVRRALAEEQVDLLHIHNPIDPILPLLFSKYSTAVTVGTFHTYFDGHVYLGLLRKIAQKYLERLDGVTVVSETCVRAMSPYVQGKFRVVPNGVDSRWFAQSRGKVERFDDGRPNILFLGRLDPRNGLDPLLAAYDLLHQRMPNARLIVAGDGPLRSYYERKAKRHLGDGICFVGTINRERPDYFATCQAFVYPAKIASFGIALLEAMAGNAPVIASDNIGFRTVIKDGVNGMLTAVDRPQALADKIFQVLGDPELAERLRQAGRKTAQAHDWSQVVGQFLDYYDETFFKVRGVRFAA